MKLFLQTAVEHANRALALLKLVESVPAPLGQESARAALESDLRLRYNNLSPFTRGLGTHGILKESEQLTYERQLCKLVEAEQKAAELYPAGYREQLYKTTHDEIKACMTGDHLPGSVKRSAEFELNEEHKTPEEFERLNAVASLEDVAKLLVRESELEHFIVRHSIPQVQHQMYAKSRGEPLVRPSSLAHDRSDARFGGPSRRTAERYNITQ